MSLTHLTISINIQHLITSIQIFLFDALTTVNEIRWILYWRDPCITGSSLMRKIELSSASHQMTTNASHTPNSNHKTAIRNIVIERKPRRSSLFNGQYIRYFKFLYFLELRNIYLVEIKLSLYTEPFNNDAFKLYSCDALPLVALVTILASWDMNKHFKVVCGISSLKCINMYFLRIKNNV